MLVLSRRANEEVTFPELGISLKVIQVKGSTVRLGIKAPREIRVLRGELNCQDQWQDLEVEVPIEQLSGQLAEAS